VRALHVLLLHTAAAHLQLGDVEDDFQQFIEVRVFVCWGCVWRRQLVGSRQNARLHTCDGSCITPHVPFRRCYPRLWADSRL
jgi:hypothetical protein